MERGETQSAPAAADGGDIVTEGGLRKAVEEGLDKLSADRVDLPRDKAITPEALCLSRTFDLILVGGASNSTSPRIASSSALNNLTSHHHQPQHPDHQQHVAHRSVDSSSSAGSVHRRHHHSRTRSAFEAVSPRSRRDSLLGECASP